MERKITVGRILSTQKRQRYGIIQPYCYFCYHNNHSSKKGIRRGVYQLQYNGKTIYLCRYCYKIFNSH